MRLKIHAYDVALSSRTESRSGSHTFALWRLRWRLKRNLRLDRQNMLLGFWENRLFITLM
jgi:hypothetical protein